MRYNPHAEWLEADGLGGFASGTVSGIRTRRYHALLLTATAPPTGRVVLVNGMEVWAITPAGRFALSSQRYVPDVVFPDGASRVVSFDPAPWPRWSFALADGTVIEQQIFVPKGQSACVITWKVTSGSDVVIEMRPLISGRDYHSTHHENAAFRFDARRGSDNRVTWSPYDGVPAIDALTNGEYQSAPEWYRNFSYDDERARGLDFAEDLASPGIFRWNASSAEAVCVLAAAGYGLPHDGAAADIVATLRRRETRRRGAFASPLHRSADAYIVSRGGGKTIVAGYPWFTDWGRDTFIALRGLCLSTGRLDDARSILVEWSSAVSEGMLPNRFGDAAGSSEFNAVDASLWYVIAVRELLEHAEAASFRITRRDRAALHAAVDAILTGYANGTRYGIRADDDGLLACGVRGVQLTWMDARVGDRVITPRIGKPVEIQALWLNTLAAGAAWIPWCSDMLSRGLLSFQSRFWNDSTGYLHDVVDADHVPGKVDETLRPNQVLALGGLPLSLVEGERAHRVLDAIEAQLLTPLGLRSLAPSHPAYVARYEGGPGERDGSYHQGTVWPWLLGPFVDAWLRVNGATSANIQIARDRFIAPVMAHLDEAGLGHVSEIADASPPFTPRGCPFQAWSLGELLRLDLQVLRPSSPNASISGSPLEVL
jgi:predicted glycogen debranching enzyme